MTESLLPARCYGLEEIGILATDSPPFLFSRLDLMAQITRRIWDDNIGLQSAGALPDGPARRAERGDCRCPSTATTTSAFPAVR
jgi:hypothetical protein